MPGRGAVSVGGARDDLDVRPADEVEHRSGDRDAGEHTCRARGDVAGGAGGPGGTVARVVTSGPKARSSSRARATTARPRRGRDRPPRAPPRFGPQGAVMPRHQRPHGHGAGAQVPAGVQAVHQADLASPVGPGGVGAAVAAAALGARGRRGGEQGAVVCSAVASTAAGSSGRPAASRGTAASTPARSRQPVAVAQDPGVPGGRGRDRRPGGRVDRLPPGRGTGSRSTGSSAARSAAQRRAATSPSVMRVGRQPVGALHAGAGDLADGEEAGDAGPPVEVGDHASAAVVRGRCDRYGLAGGVEPGRAAGAQDRRESGGAGAGAQGGRVEPARGASPVARRCGGDGGRDDVARGEVGRAGARRP